MSPLFGRSEKLCAQYSFEPNTNLEVALNAGDVVKVKKKDGDGWFTVTNVTSGEVGGIGCCCFDRNHACRYTLCTGCVCVCVSMGFYHDINSFVMLISMLTGQYVLV